MLARTQVRPAVSRLPRQKSRNQNDDLTDAQLNLCSNSVIGAVEHDHEEQGFEQGDELACLADQ